MICFFNKYIIPLSLLSIFYQQFIVFEFISPVKLYMVFILFGAGFILMKAPVITVYKLISYEICWLCFLVFNLFSFFYSENLNTSLSLFIGSILLILMYFVYRVVFSYAFSIEKILIKLYFWFVIISLFFYFFGLYSFFILDMRPEGVGYESRALFGVMFEDSRPRLRGIADSPNNFGLFIIIGYSLVLFSDSIVKSKILIPLIIFSIILTMSITTIIAMLIVTILFYVRQPRYLISMIGILLILSSLLAVFYYLTDDTYVLSMIEERLRHVSSGSGRWELWGKTIEYISERPLMGYGLNQSRELFVDYRGYHSTHNAILGIWLESGVLVLFIYLMFWFFLFRSTVVLYLKSMPGSFLFPLSLAMFFFTMSNVTIFTEIFTFFLVIASHYIHFSRNSIQIRNCK